ncbi:hypothetical protein GCM10010218_65640 [Streptomyces mashuensis]|uniref:Uncharacterized protein n=1 Tax=Streptomyces mashuensis TaxID=33904 RepID=A0A919BAS5_9ACTN|nr:hypothetical protein [Streptomyces mashuensis]GHF75540.1 hypothetical protein GCM10010218_65640 [Streptomyces mashuensis]
MNRTQIYDAFPAGGPRGSWPAEERAHELTEQGQPATVVMDMGTDRFLVVPEVSGEAAG